MELLLGLLLDTNPVSEKYEDGPQLRGIANFTINFEREAQSEGN